MLESISSQKTCEILTISGGALNGSVVQFGELVSSYCHTLSGSSKIMITVYLAVLVHWWPQVFPLFVFFWGSGKV
jgi:hypothetical protein